MIRLPVTALYGERGLKGTNRPGTILVSPPSPPTGGSLTVREVDGTPTGSAATIEFPNGSLTFPSTGVARLALPGSGTVTSVNASGGSTGFTFSGGPVTSSGTMTMAVSNAGTARTAIGLGSAAVANTGDFESAGAVSSAIASHLAAVDPHPNYTTASELASALTAYQPFDADLNAIAGLTGTNTIYYRSGAGTWSAVTIGDNLTFSSGKLSASVSGGGGGTVTSVDVSGGTTGLTFSGGPITGSGVVTIAVADKTTFRAAIGAGTSSFDGAYGSLSGTPSTFAPSAHNHAIADTTGLQAALDLKAPLANPALTGTPTAPTATAGTNTTQLATTAFVRGEVTALVAAAPTALDTLNELAAALGNDPNFATTITASLAGKQPIEATLTGLAALTPTADQLIYATGNDTFTVTSLTAFARSILDDTNAAAVLTTIGAAAASHTHGNITNAGAIGSTANLPLITTTGGAITVGAFGSTANTFCQGNDSRLSDARTPTAHTHPLSNLDQSGATTGQVASWNGTAWAPATVSGGGGGSGTVDVSIQQFRVTTESGVSVSTSDRVAQSQLHLTPHTGNQIALWDGSAFVIRTSGQVSLTLTGLTNNTNYDYYPYWDGSAVAIEVQPWRNSGQAITGATNASPIVITANSHGLSNGDEVYVTGVLGNTGANGTWIVANATTNTFELQGSAGNGAYSSGTGYLNARVGSVRPVRHQGVWTKNGDPTRRLVGTFRTTGTTTTEDSYLRRFVANVDNRVPRSIRRTPGRSDNSALTSYTITSNNTWTELNGAGNGRVDFVLPLSGTPVRLALVVLADATANQTPWAGIAIDSTTSPTTAVFGPMAGRLAAPSSYEDTMSSGYHFLAGLALKDGTGGTMTIYADIPRNGASADPESTTMIGSVMI
jgi:hypothetical protein